SGLPPGPGEGAGRDLRLHVAEGLEAEGVGEAAGRVDGEDEDLGAQAGGGHGGRRGRGGGLADAAGAAADDELPGGQQLVEGGGRGGGAAAGHQNPGSSARWAATCAVARAPWLRWNRYGT